MLPALGGNLLVRGHNLSIKYDVGCQDAPRGVNDKRGIVVPRQDGVVYLPVQTTVGIRRNHLEQGGTCYSPNAQSHSEDGADG